MFKADLHVHTLASGHAYSTLMDYVQFAKGNGIDLIGFSDHGPAMPGGPHLFHIGNQSVIPRHLEGVAILRGAEANIVSYTGEIDIPERFASRLDYMIASLHDVVLAPGTEAENTQAVLGAIEQPGVKILGHLGNPRFPIDYRRIAEACARKQVAIEINNSTFKAVSRKGSEDNCSLLAQLAIEYGAPLILGSDAHIHLDLGNFERSLALLEAAGVPQSAVVNLDRERFFSWLGQSPF